MLAQALHGGYSTEDYYSLDHPVQKYITSIVAEFADCKESDLVVAIDGCTVATFGMSIATMAFVYAKLVNAGSLRERLQMATNRVVTAMLDYPEMVAADTGRIDTDLMRLLPGRLVAKAGAEGVYTMGLKPCQRYPEGLGIALKIEDGEIGRSRNVVAIETLSQLGLINTEQKQKLFESYVPPIKNNRSMIVGEVRPAFELKFLS
jgi:L-asparaginase II